MGVLDNPLYRPVLEAIRSSRNGIVYGGKLRFSHALVMNILYRSGPPGPRLKLVLRATKDHAEVLAAFAFLYKVIVSVLRHEKLMGPRRLALIKFIAGSFSSWIVYSQHFNVFHPGITHQVTLYCFSRVAIAVGKILLDKYLDCAQPVFQTASGDLIPFGDLKLLQQNKLRSNIYNKSWKYFAVLVWGLVMLIYDYQPQYLQSSLRHSMAYIYDVDLEHWPTWRDFFGY